MSNIPSESLESCFNLETDIKNSDWMVRKIRERDGYAQNLYAALCNNQFIKLDILTVLRDDFWSCSWRYAGGIIADVRGNETYLDWYCSGIADSYNSGIADDNPPEYNSSYTILGFVPESTVTDEIRQDLERLGWAVRPWPDED